MSRSRQGGPWVPHARGQHAGSIHKPLAPFTEDISSKSYPQKASKCVHMSVMMKWVASSWVTAPSSCSVAKALVIKALVFFRAKLNTKVRLAWTRAKLRARAGTMAKAEAKAEAKLGSDEASMVGWTGFVGGITGGGKAQMWREPNTCHAERWLVILGMWAGVGGGVGVGDMDGVGVAPARPASPRELCAVKPKKIQGVIPGEESGQGLAKGLLADRPGPDQPHHDGAHMGPLGDCGLLWSACRSRILWYCFRLTNSDDAQSLDTNMAMNSFRWCGDGPDFNIFL